MAKRDDSGRFVNTHNMSFHREYGIWGNMIYRCTNKNSHLWDLYGNRGISVCDEWFSFEKFISDMGLSPSENHSLDRIDVNKGYFKDNCRWATPKEQARNRRNSMGVYIDGVFMQVDDYCEKYKISKHAIKNRIRRGWTNERIISTEVKIK